jgi:hypothetical protein
MSPDIVEYLLRATAIWAVLLAYYFLALRRADFRFQRVYLLGGGCRANASYSKKYFPESENGLFAFKTACFRSFGQEVEQLLLYDASALGGGGCLVWLSPYCLPW